MIYQPLSLDFSVMFLTIVLETLVLIVVVPKFYFKPRNTEDRKTKFSWGRKCPYKAPKVPVRNAAEPKNATDATKQKNRDVHKQLPFDDQTDFELVEKGLIAKEKRGPVIRDSDGNVVWDISKFDFLKGESPDTVNPSLWRQGQLLLHHGLYEVTPGIYQVRGYDVSVMTVIEGESGWIVIDPLVSVETARAGMQLVYQHLGIRDVVAVIYTHMHVDHFGGVKGIVSADDVESGKVRVLAPEGFEEECFSENLMAGGAMARRAQYQFGSLLPIGERGNVGVGLGLGSSSGTVSLIRPTEFIPGPHAERIVDGVRIQFLDTPGAEAPSEMMMYFPSSRALCVAEEANATMHNLYTLRGAKVRDGLLWSHWIDVAIDRFGNDLEIVFGSHHWPRFGREKALEYLEKQRDLYKYLHDQTLNFANRGYTSSEIAEMIELPDELSKEFYNRGYYGTVRHNVKAQYQMYLGWFDGNPANLDPLPPVETSKRMVDALGGKDRVLELANESFERGEYRWVAQLLNNLVFADPNNKAARFLQADALEQLGYQAESGIWRSFYLTGAKELREGVQRKTKVAQPDGDMIGSVTPEQIFQELSVHINGKKAAGENIVLTFHFTNNVGTYNLILKNGVLNYRKQDKKVRNDVKANATIRIGLKDFVDIITAKADVWSLIRGRKLSVEGNPLILVQFLLLTDKFDKFFNIVEP